MGMMLEITCTDCGFVLGHHEGCGMILPDFDAEVAKKRKAIREQVAKMKPLMVPEKYRSLYRRLYRCGHCGSLHDRLEISFQYQDSEGIHTFVADEICPKCRRTLLRLESFEPFSCPECKQGEMKTMMGGYWD